MPHSHQQHQHASHAIAGKPTFSLLRLAAWQRVAGTAVILLGLWLLVLAVLA